MARQARKGSKIKVIEPNSKERSNVKVPMVFKHRDVVEIVINRMVSTKVASDGHVGHVVEPSVADPMESVELKRSFRRHEIEESFPS